MDTTFLYHLVQQQTLSLGASVVLNPKRYGMMDEIAHVVSQLADALEDDLIGVGAEVDRQTRRLSIRINCDEIVFEHGRSHPFFDAIGLFDAFSFSSGEDGSVQINLFIDDMWGRKHES